MTGMCKVNEYTLSLGHRQAPNSLVDQGFTCVDARVRVESNEGKSARTYDRHHGKVGRCLHQIQRNINTNDMEGL